MKKMVIFMLALALVCGSMPVYAEETAVPTAQQENITLPAGQMPETTDGQPPEMPDGEMPSGEMPSGEMPSGEMPEMPSGEMPEMPNGEMPEMPNGEMPNGEMPNGEMPNGEMPEMPNGEMPGGQMPGGGQQGQPESYDAVMETSEDTTLVGETLTSTGKDENAVHTVSGVLNLNDMTIIRTSAESTGGDSSSFYGVGAAVLATGGVVNIEGGTITTDAAGGAGVFSYGDAVVTVSNVTIETAQNTSGGIHVAGGGTLIANNLTVRTLGESAAAIRSDRGSGTMIVDGGTYISEGVGSPAVYVTANITVSNAQLEATGSEALCLEGLNSVRLKNCDLSGNMKDLSQNDNTWTVILYQSMSGDSAIGEGRMEMEGGTLTSYNGGLFYTTNTESEFVLSGVTITAQEGAYFLRCTGNANQRGWGSTGANGAQCKFTGIAQEMEGDVIWDAISTLELYATQGSVLTGAVIRDDSCAGEGSGGACSVTIDADSTWVVTGDSVVTSLYAEGQIVDAQGRTVTIVGEDGSVLAQGESDVTVTVATYETSCDLSGAGTITM